MKERVIVSLTTYSKRIGNIPTVLDTIFNQTMPPDFVVLNLAYEEIIPTNVQKYIENHSIEVNRVPDTKVYKKLIPTLKKYPEDCIISIDDDWLYPKGMIEDFMTIHTKYPNYPISGNRIAMHGMQCHCGCASLQKAEYIGSQLDLIDDTLIQNCPSDDIVYTYLSNKAGYPYIRTSGLYFENMEPFNNEVSYSASEISEGGVRKAYDYLVHRFGKLKDPFYPYVKDSYLSDIINDIHNKDLSISRQIESEIKGTSSYRIGNAIVKRISWMKRTLRL